MLAQLSQLEEAKRLLPPQQQPLQCAGETTCSSGVDAQQGGGSAGPTQPPTSRLIVVANRLPVTCTKNAATGEYSFKLSSGGLVSALVSVRGKLKFVWLGWLGQVIPEADQPRIREQLLAEHNCVPVFLSEEIADTYYNGGCSGQVDN